MRPGAARLARLAGAVLATFVVSGAAPAPAAADEQPSILKAYGLDWIERVREEAWPQPKEQRPVICLLDTGVAITPDAPEDNPLGPIVARLALDGGTGLPQGDTFEHRHGTDMAAIIAAPRNGFGTVGVFPQARIVSVRVTEGEETYITPRAVALGAARCARWSETSGQRLAVVVMAESFYDQRALDFEHWRAAAARAVASGAVFVAAVGNESDAQLLAPASIEEALPVAAADPAGGPCPFTPKVNYRVILGPGCGGVGWPIGSSAATAAIGAVAAAAVTRAPTLTPMETKRLVEGASHEDLRMFDGNRVAERYFGGQVNQPPVTASRPTEDAPTHTSVVEQPALRAEPSGLNLRLWRPSFSASRRGGHVTLRRLDRRAAGTVMVRLRRTGASQRLTGGKTNKVRLPPRERPKVIEAWIEGQTWRSMVVRVRIVKS